MNNETPLVTIQREVFDKLPGLVIISGLAEIPAPSAERTAAIASYLDKSWKALGAAVNNPDTEASQRIAHWIAGFKQAGISVKKFPPSIHAIAKRAAKGGEPFRINPIVDVYNGISMSLGLPLGAFDVSDMKGGLQLRFSTGGEPFMALGSTENDPTLPGELLYSDDEGVVTRMFLWRQSQRSKIGEATRKFIFVCELLDGMGEGLAEQARRAIVEKFESLLGASISSVTVQRR